MSEDISKSTVTKRLQNTVAYNKFLSCSRNNPEVGNLGERVALLHVLTPRPGAGLAPPS